MNLISTNDKSFELQPHETLLEALERTGHEVEYQCRNGYCGACRLKLRSGSVSYALPPLAFVDTDEVLPCCCQVHGNLDIDVNLRTDALEPNQELFDQRLFD